MEKITLRLGRKSDARKVIQIHRRAIHEIASSDYAQEIIDAWGRILTEAEFIKRENNFNLRIEKIENIIVVAEIEEEVAGFGEIVISDNELVAMYVNPNFKRQGVGTAILKNLELRASQKGLKYLQLHSSITAFPFYQKNGFQKQRDGVHTLSTGVEMSCVVMKKGIS